MLFVGEDGMQVALNGLRRENFGVYYYNKIFHVEYINKNPTQFLVLKTTINLI